MLAVALGLAIASAMAGLVLWYFVVLARARMRHRRLLSLVADPDPAEPGVLVIDHPLAVAYCVPGRPTAVVVSAGTVGLLDRAQLSAVLEHEHAHARERHDLVLLPFAAIGRALPFSSHAALAVAAVSLLVEMRADDRALRRHSAHCLATALRRFSERGAGGAPAGALNIVDGQVRARLDRLSGRTRPVHRVLAALAVIGITLAISTPLSLFLLPSR